MLKIDEIAEDLNLPPEKLVRESLLMYLRTRLKKIETQLFEISKRYGVETIEELDELLKEGKCHEQEAFEDYFKLDNLEAEKEAIQKEIKKLQ